MHLSRWTLIKALFSRKPANDLYMAGWASAEAFLIRQRAEQEQYPKHFHIRLTRDEYRQAMSPPPTTDHRGN